MRLDAKVKYIVKGYKIWEASRYYSKMSLFYPFF